MLNNQKKYAMKTRRIKHPAALALPLLACLILSIGSAQAQVVPDVVKPKAASAADSSDQLSAEAIAKRLAAVEQQLVGADASPTEPTLRAIRSSLLAQKNIAQPSGSETPPLPELPSTIFEHNELLELQRKTQEQEESLTEGVETARENLQRLRDDLETAERRRRELAAEEAPTAEQDQALNLAKIESRLAEEKVNLATLELRQTQAQQAQLEKRLEPLAQLIGKSRNAQSKAVGNASAGFMALTQREAKTQREVEDIRRELANAELRVAAAQQRYTQSGAAAPEQLEAIAALRANADSLRQHIALGEEQLARIPQLRETWQRWQQALLERTPNKALRGWSSEIDAQIADLESLLVKRRGRAADIQRDITQIQERLEDASSDVSDVNKGPLKKQLATLRDTQAALQEDMRLLDRTLRVKQRLQEQLRSRTSLFDPAEWAAQAVIWLRDVWKYELVSVDDKPITTGSLVIALVLALFGLLLSRKISTLIGGAVGTRTRLDHGAAQAVETLLFYALLVTFTLLALRTINFPLTAFAFLGGALAIGVGFGSQNIMNNFISGLIIMMERPIRSRDVVEVDGEHGTVQKIGARSTQIRSTDGRNIIVPNSFFLESNVINWTLSDDLVRAKVTVGVSYGSPTRLCEKLILEVIMGNDKIIKSPDPIVIFDEFGDNSLNFDVYFWMHGRSPMAIRQVQSEVRFGIDDAFREHKIVIAFPQRDIHFDASEPVSIRMLKAED